jgi:hypothetical protein
MCRKYFLNGDFKVMSVTLNMYNDPKFPATYKAGTIIRTNPGMDAQKDYLVVNTDHKLVKLVSINPSDYKIIHKSQASNTTQEIGRLDIRA